VGESIKKGERRKAKGERLKGYNNHDLLLAGAGVFSYNISLIISKGIILKKYFN
jgi:hypothetical protein